MPDHRAHPLSIGPRLTGRLQTALDAHRQATAKWTINGDKMNRAHLLVGDRVAIASIELEMVAS